MITNNFSYAPSAYNNRKVAFKGLVDSSTPLSEELINLNRSVTRSPYVFNQYNIAGTKADLEKSLPLIKSTLGYVDDPVILEKPKDASWNYQNVVDTLLDPKVIDKIKQQRGIRKFIVVKNIEEGSFKTNGDSYNNLRWMHDMHQAVGSDRRTELERLYKGEKILILYHIENKGNNTKDYELAVRSAIASHFADTYEFNKPAV